MRKNIRFVSLFLPLVLSLFILTACNKVPVYLYNSLGEYIAYYHEGCLYDRETHDRIAQYDNGKKCFFNNNGYYGEIYNKCYLLYNENSKHINYKFGRMPVAPKAPIQPIVKNISAVSLPSGYTDCAILLSKNNLDSYGITLNSVYGGYAAFYVYFDNIIEYNSEKYEILEDIEIMFTLSITYKGYLKSDYTLSQSKTFSTIQNMSATTSYNKRESIYNLQHKYYGFYEILSSSITITSVKGSIQNK